jgi:hypothetical protein
MKSFEKNGSKKTSARTLDRRARSVPSLALR